MLKNQKKKLGNLLKFTFVCDIINYVTKLTVRKEVLL